MKSLKYIIAQLSKYELLVDSTTLGVRTAVLYKTNNEKGLAIKAGIILHFEQKLKRFENETLQITSNHTHIH